MANNLNFAAYGTIVSGIEILEYRPHPSEFDMVTQLPYHWGPTFSLCKIKIPEVSNMNMIHDEIITTIGDIEGLRYSWDAPYGMWRFEYGTTPKIYTLDYPERIWCERFRAQAHYATLVAQEKFPHLLDYDDDDSPLEPISVFTHEAAYWGKYELRLSISRQTREILLCFDRISNDSGYNMYYKIFRRLVSRFGPDANWSNRKSYICLEEGTRRSDGPFVEPLPQEKYLYDNGIVREVCTFMSGYNPLESLW
jgi:hypothetical protein